MKITNNVDAVFSAQGMTDKQTLSVGLHILTKFSAAIGHRPYVDYEHNTYGNLLIVLAAPTGGGKGASFRFVEKLFRGVERQLLTPQLDSYNIGSMKQLLTQIDNLLSRQEYAQRGDIRCYHVNEEFSTELKGAASSYQSKLPETVCSLADGAAISETMGRRQISYPLIHYSFMAHITPYMLKTSIRPSLVANGFANRMLWFEMDGTYQALPNLTPEQEKTIADELSHAIHHASNHRAVKMNNEAETRYKGYSSGLDAERVGMQEEMFHMTTRLRTHVLRLALNFAMLRIHAEIDLEDMNDAIDLVNSTRPVIEANLMPRVARTADYAIVQCLRDNGPQMASELYNKLLPDFKITKLKAAIRELESTGVIRTSRIEQDGYYPECYTLVS